MNVSLYNNSSDLRMSYQYVEEMSNRKSQNFFENTLFSPGWSVSEYNHIHSIKHPSKARRVRARALILVNGHGWWTQESAAMYEWNSKYNWQKGRRGQASRAFSQTRLAETGGMRCKTGMEREHRIEVIISLPFQDKRYLFFGFFRHVIDPANCSSFCQSWSNYLNRISFWILPLISGWYGKKENKFRKSLHKKIKKEKKSPSIPEDLVIEILYNAVFLLLLNESRWLI